jgi:urea transport system substrate-binding protein
MLGWHILEALKADQEVGNIPVIVCSWLNEEIRGLELGADCFMRMPILYADFESLLTATLVKEEDEKNF